MSNGKIVSEDAIKRVWPDEGFRLFLSHKSEEKKETAKLKEALSRYGIICFVAHEDIHPTTQWQDEIENALATMDGLVALMTEKFHDSQWTDQEIGYAFARNVPIIAVRLGSDPYGFIGKFQALSTTWDDAPKKIREILCRHPNFFPAYLRALRTCQGWTYANYLAEYFPLFKQLTEEQVDELIAAYNETPELSGSFGFDGTKPGLFGKGILHFLNLWSTRKFRFDKQQFITEAASADSQFSC
jgi:hypothetical protein